MHCHVQEEDRSAIREHPKLENVAEEMAFSLRDENYCFKQRIR